MRRVRSIAAGLLACALSGCAAYPLSEDTTARNSEDIATIVRCQTRDAIRDQIINVLDRVDGIVYDGRTGSELIALLKTDPEEYRRLDWKKFTKQLASLFLFYKDVTISYDFTIDSMEMNSAGVDLLLLRQFTRGTEKLGFAAHDDRTRDVKRQFRVFDTFDSLARLLPEPACILDPSRANLQFPSIGRIKIESLVTSFLRQNENGNLGSKDDYATPMMSDTITFTTRFSGNLDPSSQLNPFANRFVPSNIALNLDNIRQDQHTIIILLEKPIAKKSVPLFDEIGRLRAPGGPTEVTGARALAAQGLDRQRAYNTQDAVIAIGTGLTRLQ